MDISGRKLRDTAGRRAAQAAQAQDILINAEKEKRKSLKGRDTIENAENLDSNLPPNLPILEEFNRSIGNPHLSTPISEPVEPERDIGNTPPIDVIRQGKGVEKGGQAMNFNRSHQSHLDFNDPRGTDRRLLDILIDANRSGMLDSLREGKFPSPQIRDPVQPRSVFDNSNKTVQNTLDWSEGNALLQANSNLINPEDQYFDDLGVGETWEGPGEEGQGEERQEEDFEKLLAHGNFDENAPSGLRDPYSMPMTYISDSETRIADPNLLPLEVPIENLEDQGNFENRENEDENVENRQIFGKMDRLFEDQVRFLGQPGGPSSESRIPTEKSQMAAPKAYFPFLSGMASSENVIIAPVSTFRETLNEMDVIPFSSKLAENLEKERILFNKEAACRGISPSMENVDTLRENQLIFDENRTDFDRELPSIEPNSARMASGMVFDARNVLPLAMIEAQNQETCIFTEIRNDFVENRPKMLNIGSGRTIKSGPQDPKILCSE